MRKSNNLVLCRTFFPACDLGLSCSMLKLEMEGQAVLLNSSKRLIIDFNFASNEGYNENVNILKMVDCFMCRIRLKLKDFERYAKLILLQIWRSSFTVVSSLCFSGIRCN